MIVVEHNDFDNLFPPEILIFGYNCRRHSVQAILVDIRLPPIVGMHRRGCLRRRLDSRSGADGCRSHNRGGRNRRGRLCRWSSIARRGGVDRWSRCRHLPTDSLDRLGHRSCRRNGGHYARIRHWTGRNRFTTNALRRYRDIRSHTREVSMIRLSAMRFLPFGKKSSGRSFRLLVSTILMSVLPTTSWDVIL